MYKLRGAGLIKGIKNFESMLKTKICRQGKTQGSHNLRKFPQIFAVSIGVVLVVMRMHYFQKFVVASFLTTLPP